MTELSVEEVLTNAERVELARAIAESDITDGLLENHDIDALVDLFEAWLERRSAPLTIESALKELREMFSDSYCIRVEHAATAFNERADDRVDVSVRIRADRYEWFDTTLTGAMDQVRQWKESQKDQTKP